MAEQSRSWKQWVDFFAERRDRPLPELTADRDYTDLPASLARSLAIFQLGESGGGTVIEQSRHAGLPQLNDDFSDAMACFVAEENRHANILAMCVRLLGGTLIRDNWTAKLFVCARRLIGLRLKVTVLLAAEVVGLCYYHLLAARLPPCKVRDQLLEIVEDERAHLYFHCDFLRSQTPGPWRKRLFVVTWRFVMLCSAAVVAIDHRAAIRDLDIGLRTVLHRWKAYAGLAERLVVSYTASDALQSGSLAAGTGQSSIYDRQPYAATHVQSRRRATACRALASANRNRYELG